MAEKIGVWCDLYEGNPAAARRRLDGCLKALSRSGLLRVQLMEYDALLLRGRVLLAASPSAADLKQVRKLEKQLRRMRRPAAEAGAELLGGLVAMAKGEDAVAAIAAAADVFDEAEVRSYALASRRRAAQLAGDRRQLRAIDAELRADGIAVPERWAALLA